MCGSLGACGRSSLCFRLPVTLHLLDADTGKDAVADADVLDDVAQDDVVEDLMARFATMSTDTSASS
jgi:hypothetical protein